jgi:hypothetical protein
MNVHVRVRSRCVTTPAETTPGHYRYLLLFTYLSLRSAPCTSTYYVSHALAIQVTVSVRSRMRQTREAKAPGWTHTRLRPHPLHPPG